MRHGPPGGFPRGQWTAYGSNTFRFFYSPTYDVFGVISHANEPAYIFAPTRG